MKLIKQNYDKFSLIFLFLSIITLAVNLFCRISSPILTIIGFIFFIIGIMFLIVDMNKVSKRGFKFVKSNMKKSDYAHIPTKSSTYSAGYDFYADKDYEVAPNEIIKIWTDVKAYMCKNEFLMLDVRSSMGGKFMLANTIGIIDSDYYENSDNDGNIGIFLKNISNENQHISKGDRIAQGIFIEFLKADSDNNIRIERSGGWGSSGK